MKKKEMEQRVKLVAEYMLKNQATIRMCAKEFQVSNDTICRDINIRLKDIDNEKYIKVRELIEKNAKEGSQKGAKVTNELLKKKKDEDLYK